MFTLKSKTIHYSTLINCLVEIVVWLVSLIYNNCIWKKNGERLYTVIFNVSTTLFQQHPNLKAKVDFVADWCTVTYRRCHLSTYLFILKGVSPINKLEMKYGFYILEHCLHNLKIVAIFSI